MILVDTSGFFALLDRRDKNHKKAVELALADEEKLTHNYVLAELMALAIARKVESVSTFDFVEGLTIDPDLETIWVDKRLHRAAFAFLKRRPDKKYSHCDAVSFLLMRERGVTSCLTTDHHFEQEGFVRLLQS